MLDPWKKSYDQPRQHNKKRELTLPTKVHLVKAMFFPVVKHQCKSWTIKKAEHQRIDDFELWCWRRLLRLDWNSKIGISLDCKEIQPVNPKGNQPWIFIGRTDVEAETPIFWPPNAKNWLIGEDLDAGKDWRWEEKRTTEEEMVGWHHRLDEMSLSKLWELVMDREAWHAVVHGVTKGLTLLSDWTELSGETHIENRLKNTEKGEERVRCMERVTWKPALPY